MDHRLHHRRPLVRSGVALMNTDSRCQYRSKQHDGRQCLGSINHPLPHGGYLLHQANTGNTIEKWEEDDDYQA